MRQYHIALVIGSLRKESFNRRLANALVKMAPTDLIFKESQIGDLPLYNQDDDQNQHAAVKRLKGEIESSDGVLFVTAEYNRSIPGVLKNAIDNASRPYGKNSWANIAGGVIGVSVGSIGTAMAQQHLRNVMAYLDMPTLGQPEAFIHNKEGLFDENGDIGEGSRKFIQKYLDSFSTWIRNQNALK